MKPTNALPRWRGFNLPTDVFRKGGAGGFLEEDFALMAEWGFDWARLPMSFGAWLTGGDERRPDAAVLAQIDQAVAWGRQYGIHVNLSCHRLPARLWKDAAQASLVARQWAMLARRYEGIPGEQLSFNLWNEPEEPSEEKMTRADHARVARQAVSAVRDADGERLILLDGLHWGTKPLFELIDLAGQNVHQSCRGYFPCEISHYKAAWNNPDVYPVPQWPLQWAPAQRTEQLVEWYKVNRSINLAPHGADRGNIDQFYQGWVELMELGVGVHCGEMGSYNRTPHEVALAWMRDVLASLSERGIGFGVWEFRGPFGVLDSQRTDVRYEDFRGHKLDRKMLELLRSF